ncbi:hypothetical protein RJ641_008036 [Dillenia turbinata]|uniref:Protein kinase domain-containing protein n=1 Tax=Dillenia turbinata TaxID=194707 RepID=A0AAN8VBJ3_9MAGN
MVDNKGETPKKTHPQQQQPPQPQQQQSSSSPQDQESTAPTSGSPYIPAPIFEPQQKQPFVESVNLKRPRYGSGQWKLLPSPSQKQQTQPAPMSFIGSESSPSPKQQHMTSAVGAAVSSSDTASSPSHSPRETSKGEERSGDQFQYQHHHQQLRKGKYVSPVWKPNEMLWLARAWRVQYQGGGGSGFDGSGSGQYVSEVGTDVVLGPQTTTRGKTRADKDREVAEYLNRHGVNRDAKTAGTKWDNMLGEFRKVYEWERGGERERVGKSYFRLSPYERKLHRLPASFDEEVFEELAQFMGSRMRSSQTRSNVVGGGVGDDTRTALAVTVAATHKSLPPPSPFKEDDHSLLGRTKQIVIASGGEGFQHGSRGSLLGFEPSTFEVGVAGASVTNSRELRRIGKIRMTWEESVSLWGEEGELQRGRIRLQGSSFLNAEELTFFDDSMIACTMEAFEDGPLKGFSVDRFVSGQQVKVFGRRNSSSSNPPTTSGLSERVQLPLPEPSIRSIPQWEFQDPSEYYIGCLRVPPTTLPSLFELSWYIQEPPPDDIRFPLRRDVYKDLPPGKELFFATSNEPLDCRAFTGDVLNPIIRFNPSLSASTATSRDSFIGLWDDCITRIVSKFCPVEMVVIRKPSSEESSQNLLDQWPNLTGFVRNFCLWRAEETDQLRDNHIDPSSSIVEKLLWTYMDLPYILGYYAIGYLVTFCALTRSQDRVIRTDLYSLDLSTPSERLKALVPCWRIGGLLSLLADKCFNSLASNSSSYKMMFPYSDFERIEMGNGNVVELTPNTVTRIYSSKRKLIAVKEIYDFLDHRIPHAEFIENCSERDLALVFKPRGCKSKPTTCEQLVEALKFVTKALVALHDLSFMHRDLSWDKVMRRNDRENEWFVCGFEEAVGAPQIYPHGGGGGGGGGVTRAPEMGRGLHGVKVDVWGIGQLVKTCGVVGVGGMPKMLRELMNRCLDQNPENRPTAAECYHHLLQFQSSLSAAAAASAASGGGGTGGY